MLTLVTPSFAAGRYSSSFTPRAEGSSFPIWMIAGKFAMDPRPNKTTIGVDVDLGHTELCRRQILLFIYAARRRIEFSDLDDRGKIRDGPASKQDDHRCRC